MISTVETNIPNDFEAEQAILGSILYDNDELPLILSIIKSPNYFYTPAHQHIFRAAIELHKKEISIDEILLGDELKGLNQLDNIGGYSYLASLQDCVPASGNTVHYCNIIAEHAYKRQLISLLTDYLKKTTDPENKAKDLIDNLLEKITEIRGNLATRAKAVSVFDALPEVIHNIESVSKGKMEIGLISGLHDFDRMLGGGAQKGDLIFIGAEPSVGKTSLAVCLSYSLILKSKKGVIESLESSRESLIRDRLLPSALSINSHVLRSGKMDQNQWDDLQQLAQNDFLKNIKICDDSTRNINDIYSSVAIEHKTDGIDFLMIDFVQLITPVINTGNRNNDLGATARGLKKINKDFNIPIVALSQLTDEKLRDSGELEQVADVVIILKSKGDGIINAFFKKNRNGKKGDCPLQFIPEYTQFRTVE